MSTDTGHSVNPLRLVIGHSIAHDPDSNQKLNVNTENRNCGDPALSRAHAAWALRAGCSVRNLWRAAVALYLLANIIIYLLNVLFLKSMAQLPYRSMPFFPLVSGGGVLLFAKKARLVAGRRMLLYRSQLAVTHTPARRHI